MEMSTNALDELLVAIRNQKNSFPQKGEYEKDSFETEAVYGLHITLSDEPLFKIALTIPTVHRKAGTGIVEAKTIRVKVFLNESFQSDRLKNHEMRVEFMSQLHKDHFFIKSEAWKCPSYKAGNIYVYQEFKEFDPAKIAQAVASIPHIEENVIEEALQKTEKKYGKR